MRKFAIILVVILVIGALLSPFIRSLFIENEIVVREYPLERMDNGTYLIIHYYSETVRYTYKTNGDTKNHDVFQYNDTFVLSFDLNSPPLLFEHDYQGGFPFKGSDFSCVLPDKTFVSFIYEPKLPEYEPTPSFIGIPAPGVY